MAAADGLSNIQGGGGGSPGDWYGSIFVVLSGASEEDADGNYVAELFGEGWTLVIEGNRLTYAGPIRFKPPNTHGDNPTARPAGEGTIAVTCS